jgi:uncharacterized protein (TIGR02217 family)
MGQFQDVQFPASLLFKMEMNGQINPPGVAVASTPFSKVEQRLQTTSQGVYVVTFPPQVRTWDEARQLYEFCMGVGGILDTFRFRDPRPYFSGGTAEAVGTGDGATLIFQIKRSFGGYIHDITRLVAGSSTVYVDGDAQINGITVDDATGLATFDANQSGAVTGGNNVNPVELTITGHGLANNDSVRLDSFTGTGWLNLNNTRQKATVIDANTLSVPVDGSSYPAYSGNGGAFNTIPQSGEPVTADMTHDFEVRFEKPLPPPPHARLEQMVRMASFTLVEAASE